MSSAQVVQLEREWPLTLRALADTYTPGIRHSVTDAQGHNLAGHVLFYVLRAYSHAVEVHGYDRASMAVADELFAREVRYLHGRKFAPRSLVATIGTCWYNLVHERGERWRSKSARPTPGGRPRFPRQGDSPASMGQVLAGMGVGRA